MDRYELIEGSASKFWEAGVTGSRLSVRFGRIGTKGQAKDTDFTDPAAAEAALKKLIKEKTGKGYRQVGAAAPAKTSAAAPPPDAGAAPPVANPAVANPAVAEPDQPDQTASYNEASRAIIAAWIAQALPTRQYPAAPLTPEADHDRLLSRLASLSQAVPKDTQDEIAQIMADLSAQTADPDAKGAITWLRGKLGQTGAAAAPKTPAWAKDMMLRLQTVGEGHNFVITQGREEITIPARQQLLTLFQRWLVAQQGAAFAMQAYLLLKPSEHYFNVLWASDVALALRDALSAAPDHDAAVQIGLDAYPTCRWGQRAELAYLLADDRPEAHALQVGAVLRDAAADGEMVSYLGPYIALLPDARLEDAAPFLRKHSQSFSLYSFGDLAHRLIGTVLANAARHGTSALPALDWLLYYADAKRETLIARAILHSGEPRALAILAPVLGKPAIRAAVDEVTEINPALILRQGVEMVAAGRNEIVQGRVQTLITRFSPMTCRAWLANSRGAAWLDRTLSEKSRPQAALADLPAVLADPPWRKKTRKAEDLVLALTPIETPVVLQDPLNPETGSRWRLSYAECFDSAEALLKLAERCKATTIRSYEKRPPYDQPLPAPGASRDEVLAHVLARLKQICGARSFEAMSEGWRPLTMAPDKQPDWLALPLWEMPGLYDSYILQDLASSMMQRFGLRALPGYLAQLQSHTAELLPLAINMDAAPIAPIAARSLHKLKKAKGPAMAWLRKYRATAILRLIPDAVGKADATREAAEHALRWLAAQGAEIRAEIEAAAQRYATQDPRTPDAVPQVLDRDPLQVFPRRVAALPGWLDPAKLARPQTRDGQALPDAAVLALAEMLSFSTPEAVYAGIAQVRDLTTADSLGDFGWSLLIAWLAEGAPAKDGWALRCLGWIGNDQVARDLTGLIRKWPGEAAHTRAVTGLDVLADIGSDIALMNLNGIAEKVKFKGLQDRARDKITQLAEARDLSPAELADRLAPTLDLDAQGGLDLDFGPRKFRVGFDEMLKPWVKDQTGTRLKDLPKPGKADDPEKAPEAARQWAALKKDARAVASLQILRLEAMLSAQRRCAPDVFWTFFAAHPLIRHLTQRLVWGVYADDAPGTAPGQTFRIADDLTLSDAADAPLTLGFGAEAEGLIGVVHPLHLPPDTLAQWGALFGDYEITQPFPQLGRDVHALTVAEAGQEKLLRFDGIKVESARLRGMAAKGWTLGAPQDGGVSYWLERPVTTHQGTRLTAYLDFADGLIAGGAEFEDKVQTLQTLSFTPGWGAAPKVPPTFGELDLISASEMLRGLEHLAATGTR